MTTGSVVTKDGWNTIIKKAFVAGATETAPSQFEVGSGTTAPSTADTTLETPIALDGGATYFKDYVVGYPSIDTINQKVTMQGFVSSTEANGTTITEYGDFNADGTKIMFSRAIFPAITKTAAIQIFITTTLKRVD